MHVRVCVCAQILVGVCDLIKVVNVLRSYLCVLFTENLSGWGNVARVDTISPGFSH